MLFSIYEILIFQGKVSDILLKLILLNFFPVCAKYSFGIFCDCCGGFHHISPVGKQDLYFLRADTYSLLYHTGVHNIVSNN